MKTFENFIKEPINEFVSRGQISYIEKFADRLFAAVGVDIDLSGRHFFERLNDRRNGKEISVQEMIELFQKAFIKFGKKIGGMRDGLEAVILDTSDNINLPFMIKYDKSSDELDFIAKTVMRKKGFRSRTQILRVN